MIHTKVVKFLFPEIIHSRLRDFYLQFRAKLYSGDQFFCPCCLRYFRIFLSGGTIQRHNIICPGCNSAERHRLLALYLENQTNFFEQQLKVLHFAPEYMFQKRFSMLPDLDYISADIQSQYAQYKIDIMNIPYEDSSFDVVLCNHVLEHVLDDNQAMRELFRILKPGGWAILQVPLDPTLDKTYEDPNIVSPEDRALHFGQWDHVRMYGRDYKDRLEAVGFMVKVDDYVRQLDRAMIEKCRLDKAEDIYYCSKIN